VGLITFRLLRENPAALRFGDSSPYASNFIPTSRDSFSAWLTKKEGTGKTCPFFEST